MKIGAQLYSLRDYCRTLEDFKETLKKVADMGYTSVQVSGTCAYEAEWLADALKETGLTCDLTHYNFNAVMENPEKVVADHKIFGCKYIGLGAMPGVDKNTLDTLNDFIAKTAPITKRIAEAGGYFMYHNHAFEFVDMDGKLFIERLAEGFDASEFGFTLDTHWVKVGGYDPVEWLNKLAGRTPCVHFKDLVTMENGETRFAPVGSGELDFDAIIDTCLKNKVEFAFVEQDDCFGEDPFKCLKSSYDYLASKGLK